MTPKSVNAVSVLEQHVQPPEKVVEVGLVQSPCDHPSCVGSDTCIPYGKILLDVVAIIGGRLEERGQ